MSDPTRRYIKKKIIRAFKRTICKEMGKTGSSLIAIQTLPLCMEIGMALGEDPVEFARETGFRNVVERNAGQVIFDLRFDKSIGTDKVLGILRNLAETNGDAEITLSEEIVAYLDEQGSKN
jgi:hypothetical protein